MSGAVTAVRVHGQHIQFRKVRLMNYRHYIIFCLLATVSAQSNLPGTSPLISSSDFAIDMVEGIHKYLDAEQSKAPAKRVAFWNRNFTSAEEYERSISKNREQLKRIIGAVDPRVPFNSVKLNGTKAVAPLIGATKQYNVYVVSWPVLEGVTATGLLLDPIGSPVARVVAVPDADWSPEMLVGLASGVEPTAQFARRLAENGCQVLVPVIIDRKDTWSGIPGIRMTNQPHREWIYRMAFEMGRHIIGYEVQKIAAAVDWFSIENRTKSIPIAVAGYGEGGLLALYSAAIDSRINATLVSGYFQPRETLWKEPVYRDVWSLVQSFGDSDLASLIAPRALVIEASQAPRVNGPPTATKERNGATPNGRIETPAINDVRAETERARPFFDALKVGHQLQFVASNSGAGLPGSEEALSQFLRLMGVKAKLKASSSAPQDMRTDFDGSARLHRQFDELVGNVQMLVRRSPKQRDAFWSKADTSSLGHWKESSAFYRNHVWDEVIGRLPAATLKANPRTRLIFDEPKYRGYEVVLDVWENVFAYGILLVPKDMKPGERRPTVVCQHGLEGRPRDAADPKIDSHFYHRFAVRLAEEGFVTFSPQNPYIGQDRFRLIQRKAHPLKLSLFSFILGQHDRILDWLSDLPFVDSKRIGFYGLSYGGKTAVRVPPLLDRYVLSICSADFNEWVWKNTSVDSKYSYMLTSEYDMIEFDFGNVVNYSDLGNLMAPRPFMVERGHFDGVAPDEWVAYEFAKTRFFYDTKMKMPDSAQIEFFTGPHTINGKGTFEFLRYHLKWPPK